MTISVRRPGQWEPSVDAPLRDRIMPGRPDLVFVRATKALRQQSGYQPCTLCTFNNGDAGCISVFCSYGIVVSVAEVVAMRLEGVTL